MGMGIVFELAWEYECKRQPQRMAVRTVNPYRVPNNFHTFIKPQCANSTDYRLTVFAFLLGK